MGLPVIMCAPQTGTMELTTSKIACFIQASHKLCCLVLGDFVRSHWSSKTFGRLKTFGFFLDLLSIHLEYPTHVHRISSGAFSILQFQAVTSVQANI